MGLECLVISKYALTSPKKQKETPTHTAEGVNTDSDTPGAGLSITATTSQQLHERRPPLVQKAIAQPRDNMALGLETGGLGERALWEALCSARGSGDGRTDSRREEGGKRLTIPSRRGGRAVLLYAQTISNEGYGFRGP
ncbi:hypothetical protein C8034_v007535 [Colletotrichum sidae]|uniref:Uncharacterized protein n=1 Tax=Colletotrichum sidae TaxID=1347389 RepID=A0A4R8T3P3_9PEZI|nr:hypothetical protein C8034_v007535 [Colletotrichum sidae]